jgi:HAD superfamily hydrolase (TIGR01509 family)
MNARSLLTSASGILLDFDGPVCSIFAGYPAPEVAEHLREVVRSKGIVVEGTILAEADPLEVLEYVAENHPDILDLVDEALIAAEIQAAASAEPSEGAHQFIEHVAQLRTPLIVVSNNSAPAIEAYLQAHNLSRFVDGVVGRSFARPDRMKPNPWPILRAVDLAGVAASSCVLVGDSATDVIAAHAAGARCIGVANRPYKERTLPDAGADATVTSMLQLL